MPKSRFPNEDALLFGAMVERLRIERGWTLADLARVSGMNATWLGVLERGLNMLGLTTIFRLADVFGVRAEKLIREVDRERRKASEPRTATPEA